MAGGEGTRLRPLTYNQPKPLIPMGNRALMEHVVALLHRHGLRDIVVTVAFQGNAVRTYFGDGSEFGVNIAYAAEESPLGTAGSVRNAREELRETFLVISGDVLTDIDLSAVVKFHKDKSALATLALISVPNPLEFGVVMAREDGRIERFLEKPTWGQVFSDTINTGIYVFEPEIFDFVPPGPMDFSLDVFPRVLEDGRGTLYGCQVAGYWEDVGTLEAYMRAHHDILDGRVQVEMPGSCLGHGIWVGDGAEVDPKAEIRGPAIIGDYCRVEAGASVGEYTVLGRNVRVGPDAYLERTVVHDNAYVGPGVSLRGCTVGRSSDLRRGARVEEGAVVGDECFIGEHAVVRRGVKVYPFKTVEQGAVVNSSIVWESRGARTLFGRHGVAGLANVDVSPELAVRLAMAYGTTMQKGARVVVSRDSSRAARMLKRALVSGLNGSGAHVSDLDVTTLPVTRFGVRSTGCAGGLTVRLLSDDPQSVLIRFLDAKGTDISEASQRKVERIFYREDFRRCLGAEIGEVTHPTTVTEAYCQAVLERVDAEAIRAARLKVVLDYAYGAASLVMPCVLGRLGAEVLSINPYDSGRQSGSFDRWEHARGVANLVRAAGAHFGAVLGPDGDNLTLVDDTGRVLTDGEALLALLTLVLRQPAPGPARARTVALPVLAPRAAEQICAEASASLIWTKLSSTHLMEVASRPGVDFAAGQEGGYIFPDFFPAFDAVAALVRTFGLLARTQSQMSCVVAGLPEVSSAHEGVVTPWEKKGLVMRNVMDSAKGRPLVLVDGVKIVHGDGWVLVVPDPEEALTHVWADGRSEEHAQALAAECARGIRSLLRAS
jgi:mannose-1-phosphate guanylyltransferase/phosphomannomutase